MPEAVVAALAFAFDELGLHRVEASTLVDNERSIRLLRNAGFVEEGLGILAGGQARQHGAQVFAEQQGIKHGRDCRWRPPACPAGAGPLAPWRKAGSNKGGDLADFLYTRIRL